MPQLLDQRNECCRNNPLYKAANLAELLSEFLWRNTRIDGCKQWSCQRAKTKQFGAPSCFLHRTQIWLHFGHCRPSSTPLQKKSQVSHKVISMHLWQHISSALTIYNLSMSNHGIQLPPWWTLFREIKWLQFFLCRLSQSRFNFPYRILCSFIDLPFQCSHPTGIWRHNYVFLIVT